MQAVEMPVGDIPPREMDVERSGRSAPALVERA